MERYYTSVEQSKRLLELGLKPETADFWYAIIDDEAFVCISEPTNPYFEHIPCWSVGRLIQFVKDTIQVEGQTWTGVHLSFDHIGVDKTDDYTIQFDGHYDCFELNNLSLIDIIVELTERVLKNDRLFT